MAEEKKPTVRKAARTQRKMSGESKPNKELAPQKLKLLFTVVDRKKAEFYADLIQSFDVNMQFCSTAHGTATSEIRALMGLEDNEKRVIFSVIREDMAPRALAALEEKFATIKNAKGIAMTVPLTGMIGVALALFYITMRHLMDVRIKTSDDLEQLFEIPVLGQIPAFNAVDAKKKSGYGYEGSAPSVADAKQGGEN